MGQSKPHNPKFPEQDENGVDLSLIRENLRLTPTERLRKAEAALRSMIAFRDQVNPAAKAIFERLKREW